jgi:hypothetical protein
LTLLSMKSKGESPGVKACRASMIPTVVVDIPERSVRIMLNSRSQRYSMQGRNSSAQRMPPTKPPKENPTLITLKLHSRRI